MNLIDNMNDVANQYARLIVSGNVPFERWMATIQDASIYLDLKLRRIVESGVLDLKLPIDAILPIVLLVAETSGEAYEQDRVINALVRDFTMLTMRRKTREYRSQHSKAMPDEEEQRLKQTLLETSKKRIEELVRPSAIAD